MLVKVWQEDDKGTYGNNEVLSLDGVLSSSNGLDETSASEKLEYRKFVTTAWSKSLCSSKVERVLSLCEEIR